MMYLKIIFSFVLFVPTLAFANGQSKPPINKCEDYKNISAYCVSNGLFGMLKSNEILASLKAKNQKSGQLAKNGEATGAHNIQLSEQIEMDCSSAGQTCKEVCTKYSDNEKKLIEQLSKVPAPNTPVQQIQTHQKNITAANQAMQHCASEVEKGNAKAGQSKMNGTQLLLAALALLERLGLADGSGDSPELSNLSDNENDDPCNGPLAATRVSCVNASADDDSRRTAGSTTGVNPRGNLGDGGVGVAGGNNTDGIGGESKENGGNDGSFGGGFGGGLGVAGLPGGSGNGGSDKGSDVKSLDQKIAEGGYLNGGATGGGGGGSGSGIGGASPFAASGVGSAGLNPVLNSQLNQAKKASVKPNRAPASAGGNGPFADLWSVVNKSYKKNKSSLFHQK